jgi:hypothetical protein
VSMITGEKTGTDDIAQLAKMRPTQACHVT